MNHIWLIMDWNRRWAKERWLSSISGHKKWAENIEKILKYCILKNINTVSVWALSNDNYKKRSKFEISWILSLLDNFNKFISSDLYSKVKINFVWDIKNLPEKTIKTIEKIEEDTKNNSELNFVIALNYWGKNEIIRWIKEFVKSWESIENLNEDNFSNYIESMKFSPCDVVVRTWWDIRHSWFFLYSSTYTEYFFSDKKWPDFDEGDIDKVLNFFNSSKRNFWA